jgi:4'-phosphopantetheinyl transferase
MIYWLIQTADAHPNLARGIAPAGLLTTVEQARCAGLKTLKRRRDWLLGRWTAKRLLQAWLEERAGLRLPLDAFTIAAAPGGAPYVVADDDPNLQSAICHLRLSISHSGERAVCALSESGMIGADIEQIAPRDWRFVEDYFTDHERAQAQSVPAGDRDTLVTAIWSAKESALKALGLGLTVDTRSVECRLGDALADGWSAIGITCDPRRLGGGVPALHGWWRRIDEYIVTVAATIVAKQELCADCEKALLACGSREEYPIYRGRFSSAGRKPAKIKEIKFRSDEG